jgi:hypothetical protein
MAAQEILGFDASQAQHFGDLIQRQSLLAVAFQRERFERTARDVAAGDRQAFSNIIWNAENDFHGLSLACGNAISHFPVGPNREAGTLERGRVCHSEMQKSLISRAHFLRKKCWSDVGFACSRVWGCASRVCAGFVGTK